MELLNNDNILTVFIAIILAHGVTELTNALQKYVVLPFIRENININNNKNLGKLFGSFINLLILAVISIFIYRKWRKPKEKNPSLH